MDLVLLAARHVAGLAPPETLPEVAVQALLAGFDSPSLVLLAGESANADPHDLRDLFEASLAELDVVWPAEPEAVMMVRRDLARQVADGRLEVVAGTRMLLHAGDRYGPRDPRLDISTLDGLEDAWNDGFDDRRRLETEMRAECARLASG